MDGIPTASQPACAQFGVIPHRQQERAYRLPVRRGDATLDAADGRLRQPRAAGERPLTETELFSVLAND
jgi:hypothetical protein